MDGRLVSGYRESLPKILRFCTQDLVISVSKIQAKILVQDTMIILYLNFQDLPTFLYRVSCPRSCLQNIALGCNFHEKGFLFYDKMLTPVFEEKPFFIVQLRDYCSTLLWKAFIILRLRVYCSNFSENYFFSITWKLSLQCLFEKQNTIPRSRILSMNIKLLQIEESLEKIKILNFEQFFPLKVCDM